MTEVKPLKLGQSGDGQSWAVGMENFTSHCPQCGREMEGGSDLIRKMMRTEWETEGEKCGEGGK